MKPSDKGRLSKAGIIVVEIEAPAAVKLVRAGMELSHGDLLMAACSSILEAARISGTGVPTREFGIAVCNAIAAAHNARSVES